MSAGDTIKCSDIDELIEMHDALCADGYGVDFDYERGKQAVLIITEVPKGENRLNRC